MWPNCSSSEQSISPFYIKLNIIQSVTANALYHDAGTVNMFCCKILGGIVCKTVKIIVNTNCVKPWHEGYLKTKISYFLSFYTLVYIFDCFVQARLFLYCVVLFTVGLNKESAWTGLSGCSFLMTKQCRLRLIANMRCVCVFVFLIPNHTMHPWELSHKETSSLHGYFDK